MNSSSHELLELCGAVRDETASPQQIARLEAMLSRDAEAREFYRRFTQIHAWLERYETLPAPAANAPANEAGQAKRRWIAPLPWLALAAGIAVLAGLYFRSKPVPNELAPEPTAAIDSANLKPLAYVQDSHHCTVIPRAGPAVALIDTYPLQAGDIIATAPNGRAVVRFTDENTMYILTADTRAWLAREGRTKIFHLTSGQIYGDVAAQTGGAQWRILTADGEAKVLGTQLAVSAVTGGTRVAVTSGLVRVTARDSRQSVETAAGFAAELTPTTARLVKLAPTEPTRVAGFTLVNADTNQPLQPLTEGMVLDLAELPTRRINVQASCEPKLVGAVRFSLSGLDRDGNPIRLEAPKPELGWSRGGFPEQIENMFPYMLAGDPAADGQPLPQRSYAWTPTTGRYTLTAAPYAILKGAGARGEALTVHFEIRDSAVVK